MDVPAPKRIRADAREIVLDLVIGSFTLALHEPITVTR
jgi:hypothetical protein